MLKALLSIFQFVAYRLCIQNAQQRSRVEGISRDSADADVKIGSQSSCIRYESEEKQNFTLRHAFFFNQKLQQKPDGKIYLWQNSYKERQYTAEVLQGQGSEVGQAGI